MGNTNCCDSKNIDLGNAKTVYPFEESNQIDATSLKKQKSSSSKSTTTDKENAKPKSQSLVSSRDSFVVGTLYKAIEETVLKSSGRKLNLFDRTDLNDVLQQFEPYFIQYMENQGEKLTALSDLPILPKEITSTLKFYRTKLKEQFEVKTKKKVAEEAFISKNKVKYLGSSKNGIMKGICQIILGSKSFYEGKVKKNLPNGFGIMFYSFSVIYFGEFKNGKKAGRGVLEQRSTKM